MDGIQGRPSRILAGIDVDIPTLRADLTAKRTKEKAAASTRSDIKSIASQALKAGVHGLVISREYTEMRLETLSGVADALSA